MTPNPESIHEVEEVIAEVRAVRHEISARFDHDPYRLVAYYMEQQKEHPERLVRAPEPSVAKPSIRS